MSVAFRRESDEEHLEPKFEQPIAPGPNLVTARGLALIGERVETIEAAVRRETLEEAGIRLGRVVYHASQPWPFPYSLMIGCFGEALNEDISPETLRENDARKLIPPLHGALLKNEQDVHLFECLAFLSKRQG